MPTHEAGTLSAISREELAARIQYTNISPDLTRGGVIAHLEDCARYRFNAAMIAMCWVPLAREVLAGTGVKVATFFGFGLGSESVAAKVALVRECLSLGADEIDYAPNMGYFLSGMYTEFQREAAELVKAAAGAPVKAMLQLGFIESIGNRRLAARLLDEAGVPWIKNSSGGWAPGATPATPEDIRLLRQSVSTRCKVKASGGIHSYDGAIALLQAGAELLGTSSGPQIIDGDLGARENY